MAADMGYMHRPVELLSDPRKLQKSAKSVVSLGVSYYPGDHPENTGGGGRVARYAWGRDYHEVIKERLFTLRKELAEELGVRIKARGFTDRSAEHTSELQSRQYLVCRLLLDKI